MNRRWAHALVLGLTAAASAAWSASTAAAQQPDSIWYHERGTQARPLPESDTRLDTALKLSTLLRDGRVPGFYDGQFARVRERFDDLAGLAADRDLNHVLRVVAVMALQEAADGERLRAVLEPLLLPPEVEFSIEYEARLPGGWEQDSETFIRRTLAADLSQHARFSLAKDGQPEQVLAKIRVMENHVAGDLDRLLDPSVQSDDTRFVVRDVFYDRLTLFAIGYHYQQFDDYAHATEWFQLLCQNLPGHRETQMAHYNLGCIEALSGRPEAALQHLESAYAVGFTNVEWLQEDGDLASLHGRADFGALVARMRNQEAPDEAREGVPEVSPPLPESGESALDP